MLVFRADGTGWYDWSSIAFSNVKLFEWQVVEANQLSLHIHRRLRQDYDDPKKWVELEEKGTEVVLPFALSERETPVYGVLPFLQISFGFQIENGYALINADASGLKVPGEAP